MNETVKKSGELSAKKPTTFRTTLPQKAERNDALFDLWRKNLLRNDGPRPTTDKSQEESTYFSETRQRPAIAADLSIAYVMKHTTLAAKVQTQLPNLGYAIVW
jgi:hypothetical protein